jgi:hypothetical protein
MLDEPYLHAACALRVPVLTNESFLILGLCEISALITEIDTTITEFTHVWLEY